MGVHYAAPCICVYNARPGDTARRRRRLRPISGSGEKKQINKKRDTYNNGLTRTRYSSFISTIRCMLLYTYGRKEIARKLLKPFFERTPYHTLSTSSIQYMYIRFGVTNPTPPPRPNHAPVVSFDVDDGYERYVPASSLISIIQRFKRARSIFFFFYLCARTCSAPLKRIFISVAVSQCTVRTCVRMRMFTRNYNITYKRAFLWTLNFVDAGETERNYTYR